MKKNLFVSVIMLLFAFHAPAQITLEHTYSGVSAAYINLPSSGYKYYIMDVANSQCRLYNNDHSLWKTINLSVPTNYYLCDIQYVTENLFNTDNTIELLYVSYKYNTSLAYYTYDTRIVTEYGTMLYSMPGAGYSYVYPAQNGSKLFVWVYNYSVSPYTVNTLVYSIPGTVTTAAPEFNAQKTISLSNAFPNPSKGDVSIPYSLPLYVKQAELKLFSINGVLMKTYTVDHTFETIRLRAGDLMPGTYLYRLESGNFKSETLKLVVNK